MVRHCSQSFKKMDSVGDKLNRIFFTEPTVFFLFHKFSTNTLATKKVISKAPCFFLSHNKASYVIFW